MECVRESGLLGPLALLLLEHMPAVDKRLTYLCLSVLVNLADLGGAALVHEHGGLELMLGLLRSDDLSVRYYAVAGVQNMSALPECAIRVRGTGAERLLEAMLDSPHEQTGRCAAGALANIRRAARELRLASAAAVAAAAPPNAGRVDRSTSGKRRIPSPVIQVSGVLGEARTPPRAAAAPAAAEADRGTDSVSALSALAALPVSGLSLLYTVATLPFRPFYRASARPSETPAFAASTANAAGNAGRATLPPLSI